MDTKLRRARLDRQWSQVRLLSELQKRARDRGISLSSQASLKTAISRWENGHHTPQDPYRSLLVEIYETSPAALGLEPSGDTRPTAQLLVRSRLTPESLAVMNDLLATYAAADNALGPWHLRQVVDQHVVQLEASLGDVTSGLRSEALRLCSRFAEFAGWLAQDAGDLLAAQRWTDMSMDFVEEGDEVDQRSYVLMRKSGIAAERGEVGRSISLAEAACRQLDRVPPHLQVLALRQRAVSFALIGNERESEDSGERALVALSSARPGHEALAYCTPAYLGMEAGLSAFHLGRLDVAASRLSAAAAEWPNGFTRDRGLCLSRLAVVEASRGDLELACSVGRGALDVLQVADSARMRGVLRNLSRLLAPYDQVAFISEFREELAQLA